MTRALRFRSVAWASGILVWLGTVVVPAVQPAAPKVAEPDDAERRNIETAFAMTRQAAAKYEFVTRDSAAACVLREQPILRWSNPERGQIYGNVFLWTQDGRPAVVGSLFKWFSPHTHMSHEFHGLTLGEITGKFDSRDVWQTTEGGISFAPIPESPSVAPTPAGRLAQMRQMFRQFTARSVDREGLKLELRPLAQPLYRYEIPKDDGPVQDGALFVFVQGTDPEVWLLIEAAAPTSGTPARWQFAAARMNSIELTVEYQGRQAWHRHLLPSKDISSHKLPYTSFYFPNP